MPLIECPDCRRRLSDAAPACPHCGRPFSAPPRPDDMLTRNRGCGDLVLYGALAVVILLVGGCVLAAFTS